MIKRILITRADRIGDVVLATPVFKAIRERYPKAHIAVLVAASNRDLVEGSPYLDEVLLYSKRDQHASWINTYRFGVELRKKKFDAVINLHATNRMHWVTFFSGARFRIGYRKKNAFLLTHTLPDLKWKGERHETEYNFDLLRFVDVPKPEKMELYIPLRDTHRSALEARLEEEGIRRERPYILIHPSASCPSRLWRADRYAAVADELSRRWGTDTFLVAGGASDRIFTERVERIMKTRAFNLAGKLSLGMLVCLLKNARLLISNDSGPVHMAAALDVPVVAVFGRSQPGLGPRRWRPIGPRSSYIHKNVGCIECAAHRCNLGFLCLDEVSVNDVLDKVTALETCTAR